MKTLNELMDRKFTKHPESDKREKPKLMFSHRMFDNVWKGLKSSKLITQAEFDNADNYRYWQWSLAKMTDEDLLRGLRATQGFKGYFTLGAFVSLCEEPEVAPYHKPYNPNQIEDNSKSMTKEQRKAAMAKLREKVGL